MKKVVVIGGGIAGLSAGVYALQCGFDVTILESHAIAGGNCTSWKRKDYLFEGGMHWLTGSSPKEPINKIWRNLGALNDHVETHCPEPFAEYDHNGTPIRLYRDVDLLEKHWLALSPQDEKPIRLLCKQIRCVRNLSMPLSDVKGAKVTYKTRPTLSMLFSAISAMGLISSLSKVNCSEYVGRFSHEGIRNLILSSSNDTSGVMPLIFTMGTLTRGDGGFPEGGSLPFVRRIVERFTAFGGEILFNTRVERVVMQNGRAVGVLCGDTQIDADAVIITTDTMAVDSLFDVPPQAPWLDTMRKVTKPTMNTFVSLGLDVDLKEYCKTFVFKLETPISLADQTYKYLSVTNYAGDSVYSPPGKAAITIPLGGDTYDFWKQAKAEGRYELEKQKLLDDIVAALTAKIPAVAGHVEVWDVATPLTYERYCGNWRGSWMTELSGGMNFKGYPSTIESLGGVYFAGQRIMPPGGLPVAAMSGRTAVQYLCRDTNTLFISET